MIALTTAALLDLSTVHTWRDFAKCILDIHASSGLSYSDLEKLSRHSDRELKRSTVSDALHGKRRIAKPLLESLLQAWDLPAPDRAELLSAWTRVATESRRRPGPVARFDELTPRELGVHPAIQLAEATDDLPSYVERRFDKRLEESIAKGADQGCFVLLVGRSSTGKTRSLYEAVYRTVPNWWVTQPTSTQSILGIASEPANNTIVWLDELHRFLGSAPPLTRAVMSQLKNAGMIVVGTLWSDEYTARKELRPLDGLDRHADDRGLLEFAEVISVQDAFDSEEQAEARRLSRSDGRIHIALQSRDAGLTQVLAAGPDLVHRWEQAPSYAWAAMTAAADARRLGVHTAMSPDLLRDAMTGYLKPSDRVAPPSTWLAEATAYGRRPVHGTVAALSPVAGHQPGVLAGYVAADYLVQHLSRVRRKQCPPDSTWTALIDRLDNVDDIRRLCASASARMRYRHWEHGLRRLCALGDGTAHVELAMLLTRQDRIPEAMTVLRDRLEDKQCATALAKIIALRDRAEQMPSGNAGRQHLAELLFDGGETTDLRHRAEAGDRVAADDLAYLLADRGALAELRERADAGHRLAADLLAELLATHRRLVELTERADSGDEAAANRLSKIDSGADESGDEAVSHQIGELRSAVEGGVRNAPEQLTTLLFELRREADLRAEVDAGTPFAADRLLALMAAEHSDDPVTAEAVSRLRAFGLDDAGSAPQDGRDD